MANMKMHKKRAEYMGKIIRNILLTGLTATLLSSCGCANQGGSSITREGDDSSESTSIPESSGGDTSEEKDPLVSDLTEANYKEFVPNYYKKLSKLSSFRMVTKGQTVSTVLFIEVVQSIDVDVIDLREGR